MWLALIAFIIVSILIVSIYNNLVTKRQQVKEAWSNIDTQLKRRYDLIPNLLETVKRYTKYESETFDAVIKARNAAIQGNSAGIEERSKDESTLSGALKSLFALSESYPDLKANQNFLELQQELSDTENKIQAARSFYNSIVLSLNAQIDRFPSNLIAARFNFTKEKFFELEESEKKLVQKPPKASF